MEMKMTWMKRTRMNMMRQGTRMKIMTIKNNKDQNDPNQNDKTESK